MKKIYFALLFFLPFISYGQSHCDTVAATISLDTVRTAISDLDTYSYSGDSAIYDFTFAEIYLGIRYSGYTAYSWGDVLQCAAPAQVNISDSSLSPCDTAFILKLAIEYGLPRNDSCYPDWLYNSILPGAMIQSADTNVYLLSADLATCRIKGLNICTDTLRTSCDSIHSYLYVYRQLLAAEQVGGVPALDTTLLDEGFSLLYGYFLPYDQIVVGINNCTINTNIFTEITFSAQNASYSDTLGQYYLDFDLFVSDSIPSLLYSESYIFLQFDTTIFGSSLVGNNKITASKGAVISSPYYSLALSDSMPNLLKIAITHSDSAALPTIGTIQQLCHLRINLSGFNLTNVGIAFDTLAMANRSEFKQTIFGLEAPYDIVRVSGLVGAPSALALTLDMESVAVTGSPYPNYLDFDVNGFSQVNTIAQDAYLVNYSMTLYFDPQTFDSITFINYLGLGDDGNDPGGTGPGVNGGGATYGFYGTVSGNTMVIALIDSGDFDETDGFQTFDYMDMSPLAHVRMHIADCANIPNVYIDPSSSSAKWWDATSGHEEDYTPIDTSSASFDNNGAPMCVYPPRVYSWSPACTNAGSFEVTTLSGQYFGATPGTVYFTNEENPATFIHTLPQDIISWSDNQIQLLVPSLPEDHTIAASGQFYIETANGMDDIADNEQMSIGYANYNRRNTANSSSPDFMTAMFVYYQDTSFTFQMDSAMFYNTDAVNTITSVMQTINCYTGLRFQLNTATPALIDSPVLDNIHLICLKPYSPQTFPDTTTLAFTDLTHRFQSCNHGLPQYNNWADYLLDADITVNATPIAGHTWLWKDTIPSATQVSFATDILHELTHAALLCHTLPQSGTNVMYPIINAGNYYPNFSGDPDDALGIIHMLSLGRSTLGVSNCPVGDLSFYICPSPLTPTTCSLRARTTNGIEDIQDNAGTFTASLYPNPYEGTTVIHIEVSEYTDFNITIHDLVGHAVRQINIASATSFDIPLSGFEESAGMYLIQISDTRYRQVLKMIKM